MTTGLPLVARVAMKPIPTLTKPLRSVDIETHEPAQALRERTDSCVVPAAGVVGEAMLAYVLADAYRAQVRRRPHRRRARGRRRAYARADRGGAADRARLHRLHGRGEDDPRPRAGRGARRARTSTPTSCCASASAARSRRSSTPTARRSSARPRRRSSPTLLERAAGRRWSSLGGGARAVRARARGAARPHDGAARGRRRHARGRARAGARPAAGARPRARSPRCYAERARALRGARRRASCRRPTRGASPRADAALRALATAPAGHAAGLGDGRVGRVPRLRRPRRAGAGRRWPLPAGRGVRA